jgi:hypothetical protein
MGGKNMINTEFTPVSLDAPDFLLGPELMERVNQAQSEAHEANWNLKNSENHARWSRADHKSALRSARRAVIKAWNEEQMAKAAAASE